MWEDLRLSSPKARTVREADREADRDFISHMWSGRNSDEMSQKKHITKIVSQKSRGDVNYRSLLIIIIIITTAVVVIRVLIFLLC
jgi:hypothetical protein